MTSVCVQVRTRGDRDASHCMMCTEFFISMSTGHQINDCGRRRKKYSENRNSKLADQQHQRQKALITTPTEDSNERKVLDRVRIYINGYLDNMTDIEMKRIVAEAGGRVMSVPLPSESQPQLIHIFNRATAAGATHILTSQQLSASKTHRILTTRSRHQVHVVKPEWVVDSIKAGKRRPEREYAVIQVASTRRLPDILRNDFVRW
jgi:BRCT domain, a BRCA1 C-terminus domain